MKKRIEIALFVLLAVLLGYYAYQRIGIRMGGTPSSIQSRFSSEEQWMVETIVRDIADAAAYAHGVRTDDARFDIELAPAGAFDLPSVHVEIGIGAVAETQRALTLERSFWTPDPSHRDSRRHFRAVRLRDGSAFELAVHPSDPDES